MLDPILDLFRGKALTIPPLDGAFRPNTAIDDADIFSPLPEPDNLAAAEGRVVASSGNAIVALAPGVAPAVVETHPARVTAVAVSPDGALAVGLESGQLRIGGEQIALPTEVKCITALCFSSEGALWLANGSADHSPSQWVADLMKQGASGSIWKGARGAAGFERVAGGLAFPFGLHPVDGGVLVSESWAHRILRFDKARASRTTVLAHLPGYPARMSPAADGGVWLSIFAPRNRLIEFVLQEKHYRADMIAEAPPEYWIAPALSSNSSFLEPLQCGAIRTMGIHKPWSPSRSYGLVVKLDRHFQPQSSLHSRANGTRHGVCSAIETGGRLLVAAKGGDCVLSVDGLGGFT